MLPTSQVDGLTSKHLILSIKLKCRPKEFSLDTQNVSSLGRMGGLVG